LILLETISSAMDVDGFIYSPIGGSLESNVVFSQHSYLPRSTWLNFTVDVFGKSINVLEVR